ncbi:MAG: protein-glutamate O-methyltransferase [Alphaproteobacteria bacterium]|uniref:protein-glutamate O-methyltransferase n=1 Tax=Candidatus Nitrobium versatile TaxID=2884831 RepID=A0A953JAQ9_9BACT|nr:protein-glutamate O-methyltransferase [Candidatus Nitrobium versatile]
MKKENAGHPVQAAVRAAVTISDKEFHRLSEFIHTECGIKMPSVKKVMLEARLQKRLRALGMSTFSEYCDFLFSPRGIDIELVHMIDVVTTNKTDFFREPAHFTYLTGTVLPALIRLHGAGVRKPLSVWSAGCSTGEEPYTLSMVLSEFARREVSGFSFFILATDISTRVLEAAQRGIYSEDRIQPIPQELRKRYLLRSRDRSRDLVRIVPELRERVLFRRLNFMEGDFGMRELVDIVFCRNVLIYFDKETQEAVLNRFCRHLVPGGYLFLGHSETLNGLDVPLVQTSPTIYRKPR